jgi:hypothetical protein
MLAAQFIFQTTPLTVAISGVAVAIVCVLSSLAWIRSGFRRSILITELIRVFVVSVVAVLVNQPESIQYFRAGEKPSLVILVDQSPSMDTQDVAEEGLSISPPLTRSAAAQPLMAAEMWSEFEDRFDIVTTAFGGDSEGAVTDLYQAISDASDQNTSMRALVLVSDGDWNVGRPPVEAAIRLRAQQIPIFTVPLGSPSRLPDIELVSFDVPTFGSEGKSVRIPLTVESWLPQDYRTDLELSVSDGTTMTHSLVIQAMGRTSDVLEWKPESVGEFTLRLSIPKHPSEAIDENNAQEAPIAIREERLKVLVIESFPRWEYRFLRNALSRDPGVELHCLLFHPGLSKVGGGSRDYLPGFPESLEELAEYDVIFLGDVGIGEGQLTGQQTELLAGLVEQQASGLVFMPGIKGFQLSLSGSPLDPLIPILFDGSQPHGLGSPSPSNLVLTELGRNSLLTKLGDTPDANVQVWESLPGFQWHAPIVRAKAGADVLAVHRDSANQYGRIPLLVTRTFGSGKVLFMGTDAAWKWRRGVEDLYHYRFWGQVVRWMAYQRNMAKGELMRLYYSPEQPQVRTTVALNANVMSSGGEPLANANVLARIVSPTGRTSTVQLASAMNQWGAFSGKFTPDEPGIHQVTLSCSENDSRLEAKIFVQGRNVEQVGRPVRLDVMEELARVSRGEVIQGAEWSMLAKTIGELPDPPARVRRVPLWSHPLVAAGLISSLALFWVGRKMIGVI